MALKAVVSHSLSPHTTPVASYLPPTQPHTNIHQEYHLPAQEHMFHQPLPSLRRTRAKAVAVRQKTQVGYDVLRLCKLVAVHLINAIYGMFLIQRISTPLFGSR